MREAQKKMDNHKRNRGDGVVNSKVFQLEPQREKKKSGSETLTGQIWENVTIGKEMTVID